MLIHLWRIDNSWRQVKSKTARKITSSSRANPRRNIADERRLLTTIVVNFC
jgi:hypothetical protein